MIQETNLKCIGCQCDVPKEDLESATQRATWFGRYRGCDLLEWICRSCWDKGVRYSNKDV